MPLSPDFQKVRKAMRNKYGKEKGDEVFWGWVNKHKYDETKPLSEQKGEADAELIACLDSDMEAGVELGQPGDRPGQQPQPTPTGDPTKPQGLGEADTDRPITIAPGATALNDAPSKEVPLHDGMDRMDKEIPPAHVSAGAKTPLFSIPAYHMSYTAAPKFEGEDAPIIIKAVVLEEGVNVNGWRVLPDQFQSVADQYKQGRQLRTDHEKSVANVIGKSFDGAVTKGSGLGTFLGKDIAGINPEGLYVVAEFEANPRDPQVRTNILNGYVVTGSIGLDAEALCEACGTPLKASDDGGMVRQCHHLDATIDLTNVEVKEYSYVAEPAFEHTQAFPTFAAAVDSRFDSKEQTTKERNKLEEGEFAYPEERKLPINDAAHVRNALARYSQTDIPSDKKAAVLGRICRAAKKFGIDSDLCKEKGHAESSLLSASTTEERMSATTVAAEAAKKPETKEPEERMISESEAEARAEQRLKDYQRGMADAAKFRADGKEPDGDEVQASAESEGKSEADAKSEGEGEASAKVPAQFAKQKTDQIARTAPSKTRAAASNRLTLFETPEGSFLYTKAKLEASGWKEAFMAAVNGPNAPAEMKGKMKRVFEG